uniref:Uncharacterized protein LOC111128663 n=1 Tax=Crassostrea virginica TaxID=6565 RepID=A0A8B8DT10_CRAVI|nr:uncharacterized protein LOC111128663 [Crassostrea virginica]XP_022330127.1 uncharacterized protein LOC111128663 [Crassostrea virginica]
MDLACWSLLMLFVVFEYTGSGSSKAVVPIYRSKRDLTQSFVAKHIIFIKEGRRMTYELFKGRLPEFADNPNRRQHTFIVVPVKNTERENQKKEDFEKHLNKLVAAKNRNGGCKAVRRQNDPAARQHILRVNPIACRRPTQNEIQISDYYTCEINMRELGLPNALLVEFNVQDRNDDCRYSNNGEFTVGVGIHQGVNSQTRRQQTNWFTVNHLAGSQLDGGSECDEN